jgi:hypothetical protein
MVVGESDNQDNYNLKSPELINISNSEESESDGAPAESAEAELSMSSMSVEIFDLTEKN